jgi:uncharacterized protein (DUF433 family)
MSQVELTSHIEVRPGVLGDRAYVAGHRVRVQDIVLWNEEGLSPDEIVSRVPTISLADVHAALAYYYDHREEIDRQIRDDDSFANGIERSQLSP